MPSIVKMTTVRSSLRMRVLYISAVNTTMNTGAVNCSTIALAAVVSLFAQVKQVYTQAVSSPDKKVFLFSTRPMRLHTIYTAKVSPAIRLRIPATAKPFHGTSFMNIPAMLQSVAAASISIIATLSFFMTFSV